MSEADRIPPLDVHLNPPIHDPRRYDFATPQELLNIFQSYPLTEEFIDWVVEHGFLIIYRKDMKAGKGEVVGKFIEVSSHGAPLLRELTLIHELIHVAIPRVWTFPHDRSYERFEAVIDQIAQSYLRQTPFLSALRLKIPASDL